MTGRGNERIIQEELIGWELMIDSSSQLRLVFANPTISQDQKRNVLEELIARTKVDQITANFLRLLVKNQRLEALKEINKRFSEVLDLRSGVVAAHVTTARPVSDITKETLKEKLARFTNKQVRLNFTVDESLIGGIVTRIGSTVYDGSIKTQLERMEHLLAGQ